MGETREDQGRGTAAEAPLGHCWDTAGAQLSNLQLVPGRDNIGDVGL